MKAKYLVIRMSSMGDIVLTTPLVRCLKNQVEGAEVHYLVKRKFLPIIQENPYIDKIHVFDRNLRKTIAALKKEQFHYIIDLHNNIRSFRIKKRLNILSFTFNKISFRKWLLNQFGINILPKVHVVDRIMKTVELFDVQNDGKGLDYFIPDKDHVPMETLPTPFQYGYIAFMIGAMHFTKRLPPEKIIEICTGIKYPILLLGGPAEKKTGEVIAKASGQHVLNTCGKYNMNQSVSLLDQSHLVISHDTGLMHIAAAREKDVFSIWGTTTHEFGVEPYMAGRNSIMFEVKGLKCRPCSRYGRAKCPKKHFKCMWDIPDQDIVDQANRLVKA